jgi:uncharacterized protein (DUF58 family)
LSEAAASLRAWAAEVVARAGGGGLPSALPRDGGPGGVHAGLRRGGGVEFAEHRDYAPGDDLRHLDWRAVARSDRLLIKRFEVEVRRDLWLVVDGSASMALAAPGVDRGVDKLERVRLLALCLALVALQRGDRVGVEGCPDGPRLAPRGGAAAAPALADALTASPAGGAVGLEAWRPPGREAPCAIVALSDVLAPPERALAPLAAARRLGHEVLLLHTLHPLELDFEFGAVVGLRCAERGERLVFDARQDAADAAARMATHCREVEREAASAGLRLLRCSLGDDPAALLRAAQRALAAPRRRP